MKSLARMVAGAGSPCRKAALYVRVRLPKTESGFGSVLAALDRTAPRNSHCWQLTRGTVVSKQSVLVNFIQALCAIVLGNIAYFLLVPSFPPIARHRPLQPDLGLLIDFWFCLVAYGLIRTARRWR
jgi:hypothetical protein